MFNQDQNEKKNEGKMEHFCVRKDEWCEKSDMIYHVESQKIQTCKHNWKTKLEN